MKNPDLLTESYDFDLDPSFIAARPAAEGRDTSKLLVYKAQTGEVIHTKFSELSNFLNSGELLVKNQSRVFPCRLFGNKPSGGKVELFVLSLIPVNNLYPVMIRSSGKKKVGDIYLFDELSAELKEVGRSGEFLVSINLSHEQFLDFLDKKAGIPIPPYIRSGVADEKDETDYQTVYAKDLGSVAAPTAGLHFTEKVFSDLSSKGVEHASVTLHVGAGTFKTVDSDNILEHEMHSESFIIDDSNLEKIKKHKRRIAVGTTTLRVLESASKEGEFNCKPNELRDTDIFLYPGVDVHSICGLITNFHLPKSTLLMLVSALIGREKTLELYEIAKKEKYRFFSYGDAMLILR